MQCDESLGESHRDEKNPGDDNQPSSVLYTGTLYTQNTSFLVDHAQKNKNLMGKVSKYNKALFTKPWKC